MSNFRRWILAVVLALAPALAAHAARTDVIVLVNGNSVTGEIESLDFGSLRYATDSMGTVNVDWEDIVAITSEQDLQIEVTDGTRYFGNLIGSDQRFVVRVRTSSGETELATDEIVNIVPIERVERFWQRIEGSFSLGLQTQKSSEVTTSSFNIDLGYREQRYLIGLRANSSITDQPDRPTSARQSLQGNFQRFRDNRWFTDWFTGWEKNDELGIEGRVSAGAAIGRFLIQSNTARLPLTAGVQASRENFNTGDDSTTNGEGRIEARYQLRSIDPEGSLTLTTQVFPLLEDLSNFRGEADLSWRREFIEDLFFDLTVGYSYQSDPPEGAQRDDYVLTTSIGYSF